LSLARYESGAVTPRPVSFDLADRIHTLAGRMASLSGERRVTIDIDPQKGVTAVADPGLTDIVIGNILSNALKYSSVGGEVKIRFHQTARGVLCRVSDTGIGIAPEHLARVFDRFYRTDASRVAEVEGAGLGLTIVRRLADLQGLEVEIVSELGKGTLVTVLLPAHGPEG
jgi:signal transduction histidine kinase